MFGFKKIKYLSLAILTITVIIVWSVVFEQVKDNILEVHFFDVGQGDAIFIETPNGQQVLIDGGPDKTVLEKLSQVMPFYDRKIDLLILTHPDADHITGLVSVLEYYNIGRILFSGLTKDTAIYQKWQDLIEDKEIPLTVAQAGQQIILQEGIVMKILWPDQSLLESFSEPCNNVSIVGQLIYGRTEFLLTGDIEKKVESHLLKENWPLESDILKVAHHGSKTSSSYDFLKAVNPQIAVISVGEKNRYKHPHEEVLERLKDILVYRTDDYGDIEIMTDGVFLK